MFDAVHTAGYPADLFAGPQSEEQIVVNIGIVGCGGITTYHAGYLEKIAEANIVALCDISPEAIEKMREAVGPAAGYDSVDAMLAHDPHGRVSPVAERREMLFK